jgi:outer membrane lipoprotein LolB
MSAVRPATLGALMLLGGCAAIPQHGAESTRLWEARHARLAQIEQFTVQARVSSGFFGSKADLHWRQRGDDFEMRVTGPFGAGAVNISSAAGTVTVRTARETYATSDPELFLFERLGWTFPVRHLRWWALGVPAPNSDSKIQWDDGGRLLTLAQDGWTLEFGEYQAADGLELPRKFTLANPEVAIKVVVDAWSDLPLSQ